MTRDDSIEGCADIGEMTAFAAGVLPEHRAEALAMHVSSCARCDQALKVIEPLAASMSSWPWDIVSPPPALWERLAIRVAPAGSPPLGAADPVAPAPWREVAEGISCKVLATDFSSHRVSLLVRLHPGMEYPPHEHAEAEELHLLDGELWINHRKLLPGDYHRAEAGSADRRVWSETGCTCVLITSLRDRLTATHIP